MKYSQPYRDAVKMQRVISAQALDGKATRKELCALARAFKELEELKLRLRMKPAPKAVDVMRMQKVKRSVSAPLFSDTE